MARSKPSRPRESQALTGWIDLRRLGLAAWRWSILLHSTERGVCKIEAPEIYSSPRAAHEDAVVWAQRAGITLTDHRPIAEPRQRKDVTDEQRSRTNGPRSRSGGPAR